MVTDPKVYKLEEVASHNTPKDCWLVMFGKVYDVTEFMDDHPGGGEVLLTSTGKDATEDFEDVGHSKAAREQLSKYRIGDIDESSLPMKKSYAAPPPKQSGQNSSGGDFVTRLLQFLVPLMILALALAVRHYTRQQDPSSPQ
uniref:Cytochrome b5 heme-binding domain-containing protein n=1 Tax=Kalanchoe fedtschenkoi TaxID=63787 RepID=A0A7N0U8Z0_KALFE